MPACCDPGEYDVVFTSKYARRTAKSLRKSGLDDTATKMADFLTDQGLDGATVLEIGGGVGGLHLELIRRGASQATNAELSGAYESEAAKLLAESGLADRVTRRIADVVTDPGSIPSRGRRSDASGGVLLSRLRRSSRVRGRPCPTDPGFQLPTTEPAHPLGDGAGERGLRASATEVSDLRAFASGDARGADRAPTHAGGWWTEHQMAVHRNCPGTRLTVNSRLGLPLSASSCSPALSAAPPRPRRPPLTGSP